MKQPVLTINPGTQRGTLTIGAISVLLSRADTTKLVQDSCEQQSLVAAIPPYTMVIRGEYVTDEEQTTRYRHELVTLRSIAETDSFLSACQLAIRDLGEQAVPWVAVWLEPVPHGKYDLGNVRELPINEAILWGVRFCQGFIFHHHESRVPSSTWKTLGKKRLAELRKMESEFF